MKSSEKKMILVIILIGVVIIGGLLLWQKKGNNKTNVAESEDSNVEEYVQKLEDGSKLNVSEELQKTKTLDELEITNIQLKEIGGITTLLADVNNKGSVQTEEKKVKVEILDKNGETITTLKGIIDKIPAGESVQLNMAVTADVANAYNFRISNY